MVKPETPSFFINHLKTPKMIGFDSIKSELLNSFRSQKLHHAIIIHSKKGIGKASFAKEFALEILNQTSSNHPDLLLIEKDPEKREINVDKIRGIFDFSNRTSANSPQKFIVIDSACELNKSSSNALLKILEEPHPNNFLILISHNLNRILPTIRSRCHIVKIPNLSAANFYEILQKQNLHFSERDLKFISEICDNSPAEAINLGLDLTRFYELFLRSIYNKKLSEELLKNISDKKMPFEIFEKSYEFFMSRLLKNSTGNSFDFFFDEERVFFNLCQKFSTQEILALNDLTSSTLHKTNSLNLDKKLILITIFNKICYE